MKRNHWWLVFKKKKDISFKVSYALFHFYRLLLALKTQTPWKTNIHKDDLFNLILWCLAWWRHQMETFSTLLAICAGKSPVPSEYPAQRPVTRSFHVFFDLRLNKQLIKQSWGWWFETLSRPLWRHRNGAHKARVLWHHVKKIINMHVQ